MLRWSSLLTAILLANSVNALPRAPQPLHPGRLFGRQDVQAPVAEITIETITTGSMTVQMVASPTVDIIVEPTVGTTLDRNGRPTDQPFPDQPTPSDPLKLKGPLPSNNVTLVFNGTDFNAVGGNGTVFGEPMAVAPEPAASSSAVVVVESDLEIVPVVAAAVVQADVITPAAVDDDEPVSEPVPTADPAPVESPAPAPAPVDLFAPIATTEPPAMFTRGEHPVHKNVDDAGPSSTNKFYTNMMLYNGTMPVFTYPYIVKYQNGNTLSKTIGLSMSHNNADADVFGPDASVNPARYYVVPSNAEDLVVSAEQLKLGEDGTFGGQFTVFQTTETFGKAVIVADKTAAIRDTRPRIEFPLCQGMGFVTALYYDFTPTIHSGASFLSIGAQVPGKKGVTKFKVELNDGKKWLMYATRTEMPGYNIPVDGDLKLDIINENLISSDGPFHGMLQIARLQDDDNNPDAEALYDAAAGAYCNGNDLSATVTGSDGSYNFNFRNDGVASEQLLMFAFPHHVDSITSPVATTLKMQSSVKGMMTAYVGNVWSLSEQVQTDLNFGPWRGDGKPVSYSPEVIEKIRSAAAIDAAGDFNTGSDLDSMYYSGKALTRAAQICWVVKEVVKDDGLAQTCLDKLKEAFSRFSGNTQKAPLVYDSTWGGLVSSAGLIDDGADFGNAYYNDHHFHFGYHVYAAAVIAHLDPAWLDLDGHRDYVNTLIRDFANPSSADPFFPRFRSFDWFAGHSWAKGVYESADGKDQESTSEDYFASYGMKMWAQAVGDTAMDARASLMLAIQRRTIPRYFLLSPDNDVHPERFRENMVPGIMFEGKVDCATYFGTNNEYIHGIQMLPLSPVSNYVRPAEFVKAEFEKFFNNGPVENMAWRGLIQGNKAIYDPVGAWSYFQDGFDMAELDGGASLTWYLTWIAGIGGA